MLNALTDFLTPGSDGANQGPRQLPLQDTGGPEYDARSMPKSVALLTSAFILGPTCPLSSAKTLCFTSNAERLACYILAVFVHSAV